MDDTVIQVTNLSKEYRLGVISHGTLSHDIQSKWARFRRTEDPNTRLDRGRKEYDTGNDWFWALNDVSFQVQKGEILGIIGRNGAGKSTLLKILSRVTAPTRGIIKIKGRIASLLEVGTGFHPELTGRENVFLNGTILGMTKKEIEYKFDEIIRFAEIEKFIDTPVKRYSSGMYVRLAFAVAAHLDPEILIVDEVLAVGDAAFQKKCLGKMGDVAGEGRTVLFVSHNMAVMNQLCSRIIWLENGRIKETGSNSSIIREYLKSCDNSSNTPVSQFVEDIKKEAQLLQAKMVNEKGEITSHYSCDEPVIVKLSLVVHQNIPGLYGYLEVKRGDDGMTVMVSDSFDSQPNTLDQLPIGSYTILISIPMRTLGPGDYKIYLNFTSDRGNSWNVDSPGIVTSFSLCDHFSKRGNNRHGFFSTMLKWQVFGNKEETDAFHHDY